MCKLVAVLITFCVFLKAGNSHTLADETCGPNEKEGCSSVCKSDYCPRNEEESQRSQSCVEAQVCTPACRCRFNYKRDANGTCIPGRSCPRFECRNPNEEFVACPPLCPGDSCAQASPTGRCPFGRIGIILECKPKCRCIKNYWRKNGVCVPYEECLEKRKDSLFL